MEVVYNVWYTGRAARYLMDGISRDNDVTREEFLNDYYHGNKPQEDNDIMHRSNRNHSETGRGGGVGENGGLFRCGLCGPPNKGDDFHALLNDRLKQIMDPNYEIPKNDTTERKFLGQCRLYIGNLVDCTEEELIEMFKPYGEVSDIFFVRELMIGFIKLDYRTNAEKAKK